MGILRISEIYNMIAKCRFCEWEGYGEECNLVKGEAVCPECNNPVELYPDDFSPSGEDW